MSGSGERHMTVYGVPPYESNLRENQVDRLSFWAISCRPDPFDIIDCHTNSHDYGKASARSQLHAS